MDKGTKHPKGIHQTTFRKTNISVWPSVLWQARFLCFLLFKLPVAPSNPPVKPYPAKIRLVSDCHSAGCPTVKPSPTRSRHNFPCSSRQNTRNSRSAKRAESCPRNSLNHNQLPALAHPCNRGIYPRFPSDFGPWTLAFGPTYISSHQDTLILYLQPFSPSAIFEPTIGTNEQHHE